MNAITTIIARQYADRAVVLADSQVSANERIYNDPRMNKIAQQGRWLIAGAGNVAPCDIAVHIWKPPAPTKQDSQDLYHFMVTKVIPSLKQCFKDNQFEITESEKDSIVFQLIVVIDGHIFEINDDFSVLVRADGIYSIGSGYQYAIGAMSVGAEPSAAMDAAIANDVNSCGPVTTKVQKIK